MSANRTRRSPANRGAQLVVESGASLAQIAAVEGCTRTTAARHRGGDKLPSDARRAKLQAAFGIPPASWDEPAVKTAPSRQARARGGAPHGGADMANAGDKEALVDPAPEGYDGNAEGRLRAELRSLDAMKSSGQLSQAARLEVTRVSIRCAAELGKISGENLSAITEARILRSPQWRRLKQRMLAALRPYPKALKAIGKALHEGDEEDP
ncbi:MAG TPA: hypothetical protein VK550_11140 [Polyangiaceae bacterium]|nr:hypothetical protein [Polyangiaceae bacterium]